MTTSTAGHAPGVRIQFADPPPAVEPVRVDVPVFVCVCERGPLHTPVRIGAWPEFGRTFGGFVANGLGAYAVKAFFDQGGRVCWIVRVAAAERTAAPAGPQPPDRRTSVLAPLDGFVPGAAVTVRQGSAAHTYLVTGVDATSATVAWDRPLHPAFDLTVAFTVATGAGSATATLPGGGGDALRLAASGPGAWGDRLDVLVTPGRKAATANRPAEPSNGTATPVAGTEGFVAGSTVRVSQDVGGVVTAVTAVVDRVDRARGVLWWTAPLPVPPLVPGQPMTLETSTVTLSVRERGATVEVWPDLSPVPAHPRYLPAVLAASPRIGAVEVLTGGEPLPGRYPLTGGRDGTAALTTGDLTGDELLGDGLGLAAARDLTEPAAVALPDLVGAPTPARVELPPPDEHDPCAPCPPPPGAPPVLEAVVVEAAAAFGAGEIVLAQQRVIESCERNTERVALLDPPAGPGPLTATDLREWSGRFSSSYAVAVVPWLTVVDPLTGSRGVRRVPASGHLAGLMAQTDAAGGPWLAAANRGLAWAHGADTGLTEAQHAVLNEAGVVVIRALPGRGLVPMGCRTLSADPLWVFAPVRRTMIYLRRALRLGLAWTVFEPNGPALARLLTTGIATLLRDVWEAGGLAGATADDAFYLAVDQTAARAGELLIEIGVALTRPAEFVTVRVSRLDNRLELREQPERGAEGG
jgi:uncharacterized protein